MSETVADHTWLDKEQVAQALGCTTKSVERFARAGKLQQSMRATDGRGPERAVYHPADVARLARERRRAPLPFVLPAGTDTPDAGNGHQALELPRPASLESTAGELLQSLLGAVRSATAISQTLPMSQTSQTLFLTLPEAAAASGLSERCLRRYIDEGKLPAVRDRALKIRRRDLEQL